MRRLPPASLAFLALAAAASTGLAEEQPLDDLTAAPAQTVPVELPPDIRHDMRSFLDTLGSKNAEAPVPEAPAAEIAEEPVPQEESHAESEEVAEATVPQEEESPAEVAEAPVPEEPSPQKEPEPDPVEAPMFDRLAATYAEHNGLELALARDVLADKAKAEGLSCEAYAEKVLDEAGVSFDEAGALVDKSVKADAPSEAGDLDAPAVRGDEAAATVPQPAAQPPAMVPQTIADLAAAYPMKPAYANSPTVDVLVAPNGFTWQGLEVKKQDLVERIRIFGGNTPGAHLRIQTYQEVPFETMRDVMAAAQDAGIAHVSVAIPSVSVPRVAP